VSLLRLNRRPKTGDVDLSIWRVDFGSSNAKWSDHLGFELGSSPVFGVKKGGQQNSLGRSHVPGAPDRLL
jgi:hypothetical protein